MELGQLGFVRHENASRPEAFPTTERFQKYLGIEGMRSP